VGGSERPLITRESLVPECAPSIRHGRDRSRTRLSAGRGGRCLCRFRVWDMERSCRV
jgi:hypothetical protein